MSDDWDDEEEDIDYNDPSDYDNYYPSLELSIIYEAHYNCKNETAKTLAEFIQGSYKTYTDIHEATCRDVILDYILKGRNNNSFMNQFRHQKPVVFKILIRRKFSNDNILFIKELIKKYFHSFSLKEEEKGRISISFSDYVSAPLISLFLFLITRGSVLNWSLNDIDHIIKDTLQTDGLFDHDDEEDFIENAFFTAFGIYLYLYYKIYNINSTAFESGISEFTREHLVNAYPSNLIEFVDKYKVDMNDIELPLMKNVGYKEFKKFYSK